MRKSKVFTATSGSDLETQINSWLIQNTNIHIEESLYQIGSASLFSLVLIYTVTA